MDNIEDIEVVIKGIITAVLAIYVVIYALRPSVMYPDYILDVVDNPWVFVILLMMNYYVFLWDSTIGVLLLLILIAMVMDVVLFTEGFKIDMTNINSITGIEHMANAFNEKDIYTILFGKLQEQKEKNKTSNPRPYI